MCFKTISSDTLLHFKYLIFMDYFDMHAREFDSGTDLDIGEKAKRFRNHFLQAGLEYEAM